MADSPGSGLGREEGVSSSPYSKSKKLYSTKRLVMVVAVAMELSSSKVKLSTVMLMKLSALLGVF